MSGGTASSVRVAVPDLGDLQVTLDSSPVRLGRPQQAAPLALLVAPDGRTVPTDRGGRVPHDGRFGCRASTTQRLTLRAG